jgi:uncharacterized integral membrane protein
MKAKSVVALSLVVLLIIFALQNNETVTVWLLFWQVTGSRAAILVLTFVIGAVAGLLLGMQAKRNRSK